MPRHWIWMQVTIVVLVIAAIVIAITKLASSGTGFVSVSVSPTAPAEASIANVDAVGPYTSSRGVTLTGLPSSVQVTFQKGFDSTAATAVKTLCTPAQASSSGCPSNSNAGHGELDVIVNGTVRRVPLLLYVGPAIHPHDRGSLLITGSAAGRKLIYTARLFLGPGGGLNLLTSGLAYPGPANFDKLVLVAGTQRTSATAGGPAAIHSVITNPPSCSGGQWTAQGTMAFPNGSFSQEIAVPCG